MSLRRGAAIALTTAVSAATLVACGSGDEATGLIVGTTAGYVGGWTDTIIMRIVDALLSFPALVLAIALAAAFGPSLQNAMLAVGTATHNTELTVAGAVQALAGTVATPNTAGSTAPTSASATVRAPAESAGAQAPVTTSAVSDPPRRVGRVLLLGRMGTWDRSHRGGIQRS